MSKWFIFIKSERDFYFIILIFLFIADYYFSNPNTANRFVPSSQYQNRRPFSSGSTTGASSPGSYQEQILFIGNESKQPSSQPLTSAAYTPFGGQQYTVSKTSKSTNLFKTINTMRQNKNEKIK